ncbi:FimD/PapC N-terminal domain-containing protein [Escherichia coli]|nr:FimD/PapC N-terminal domain-containing protein [Escherichia coli]
MCRTTAHAHHFRIVWLTHHTEFDVGQQHLSLSVPQIYVGRMARGYVSPDLWEEGINAGLLNYSFNGNSINNQ